jgi:hypothetical protein
MVTTSITPSALHVGLVTALLLLVPAVAMLFTAEVAWGPGDFAAAAALLVAAGMALVLGSRRAKGARQRVAVGLIVFSALATVWAELAVGVFS